ncbi:conserved exported hypothetical protein [Flavobacterium sp. 9AF]|uniref:DUF4129 domain-containing protein n=1 Tax=Flavobacterium sp. 9AF TaxID=2653142 RepID=UPI0012F26A54|nr:DUF4129 domain-containing protein [Flavobacterium sp. 9AF]VXB67734.1 conserved exported hypothetical protein [Flavobacterium sp. 9AF]
MNKIICLSFLFFSLIGFAQSDSLAIGETKVENDTIKNNQEHSIIIDSIEDINPKHFETNFKEKYTSNDFKYETLIDSKQQTAWDRFWKAVDDFFSRLFDFRNSDSPLTGFEIFMKIIAFLIIGFVIYLIVRVIIGKETYWVFSKNKKKITVSEMVEENIHAIDFNTIISKAKENKEYRLTIRYYYLWLLKSLSDKQIIDWDIEKTNSDYLYEIQSSVIQDDFKYLSYLYDYIWYGEFDINETDFLKAEKAFKEAITSKK